MLWGVFFLQKRAEYGSDSTVSNTELSELFFALTEFQGESSVSVPRGLVFVCKSELTEFFAELTEFAPKTQ